ncbi:hypothetical protein MBLNU457_6771t2 [Dothideomycetes sp. NU457]
MAAPDHTFGAIDYVPNPHFVFPAQPLPESTSQPSATPRRTTSLTTGPTPSPRRRGPQHKSVSTLPTFTFNATDTSGHTGEASNEPAGQISQVTPRAIGHRRGASEFVGGDARKGMADFVSTSPVKSTYSQFIADTASPARKRGHAHRRSAAMSGHDLASILQPRDTNVTSGPSRTNLTQTLLPPPALPVFDPNNVLDGETRLDEDDAPQDSIAPIAYDDILESSTKVGFADEVEIIPRALSPISASGESGASTPVDRFRGNSISSALDSPSTTYSPTVRPRSVLSPKLGGTSCNQARPSVEMGREIEKEGHWLRKDINTPLPDSDDEPVDPVPKPVADRSKLSVTFNVERRKSDPYLSTDPSRHKNKSSVSLQEPVVSRFEEHVEQATPVARKPSAKKVKAWASSMFFRKEKTLTRPRSAEFAPRVNMPAPFSPDMVPSLTVTPSDEREEPDLEELFSSQDPFSQPDDPTDQQMPQPRIDFSQFVPYSPPAGASDDFGNTIDLDAMFETPSRNTRPQAFAARRQLHSGRGNRDFGGSQGQFHRRTESAPVLARFDYSISGSPVQSPMADVFEEDEEEDEEAKLEAVKRAKDRAAWSARSTLLPVDGRDESQGVGIKIVDMAADADVANRPWTSESGLGIRESLAVHSPNSDQLSYTPDRRPSLIESTIVEEPCMLEIVGDYEEPRASTITKSSDSSDTPTILVDNSGAVLTIPAQSSIMTPTTYAASTFSTPDFTRRQCSFETSRLGTSASSMTDCRTMSSFAPDQTHANRTSVDDVPSLTSSRSTMISGLQGTAGRRDASERSVSAASVHTTEEQSERRRKRSSIQSLSKLMGASFGESKSKAHSDSDAPSTSSVSSSGQRRKKEHRLSRLMFWKNKQTSSDRGGQR